MPNFAFIVGSANNSWTLKADIASLFFAKLLNYMRANKVAKVVPREDPRNPVNHKAFDAGLSSRGGRCIVKDASFARCFAIF